MSKINKNRWIDRQFTNTKMALTVQAKIVYLKKKNGLHNRKPTNPKATNCENHILSLEIYYYGFQ